MNDLLLVRPPAVPLITHTPYFSVWSASDRLTDTWSTHWTGSHQPMSGLIRVDGTTARFLGKGPEGTPAMDQIGLDVTCTRSTYRFRFNGVELTVEFMSPLIPDDLDLLTRPVTFITASAKSIDGKPHQVSVYFDASSHLAVDSGDQKVVGARHRTEECECLSFRSLDQRILARRGDNLRIDWGSFFLVVPHGDGRQLAVSNGHTSRAAFELDGAFSTSDDMRFPRESRDGCPVLAAKFELGEVSEDAKSVFWMVAYDEEYAIEYFHRKLPPYWRRNGMLPDQLFDQSTREYEAIRKRCQSFDQSVFDELVACGGEKFAKISELAFRQCLCAHGIVQDFDGTLLMFSKENFSNGCIGTVDVTYPGSPFFLRFNTDLLKAQIVPILDYSATERWRFPFAPHDLGTYPMANGQVYGGGEQTEDDQMPVEECGNMLLLVAALCMAERSTELADKHWTTLSKWAGYLMQSGLDPENQLCTDDFAGHMAHNANLSLKAIMAIGAFGKLCYLRGDKTRAQIIHQTAQRMAEQWEVLASDGTHYRLAFDREGTWSQKYNLVWDRLLGLNLFPIEVVNSEIRHYLEHQNEFGLPLDSRADYTKGDWVIWTASLANSRSVLESLVSPLFDYINKTPSRVPFSDWHDTKTAKQIGFQARSVVGGIFIPLLKTL